jgi:hypothetical protein
VFSENPLAGRPVCAIDGGDLPLPTFNLPTPADQFESGVMATILQRRVFLATLVFVIGASGLFAPQAKAQGEAASTWRVGTPIVSYFSGPTMTDEVAQQMADGGWNLVWCDDENQLDIAQRHGLRAQFCTRNGLLSAKSLDDPAQRAQLDALVDRVRKHPAMYSYYVIDEPSAVQFPDLGRVVAYLRERDPAHMAYINLFPHTVIPSRLGAESYQEHLRQFFDVVKPVLLSYDRYHFFVNGDHEEYFPSLAIIRQTALQARVPFLNIVQAASWKPIVRVPTGDEMRYLVYTTLAYGAQGISYYVYCAPGHQGGIALPDGTPTPLYDALKPLNREFVAIATELQPLSSLAVYHTGMLPPGTVPLPSDAPLHLDPPGAPMPYENLMRVKGFLLGFFGATTEGLEPAAPTHVVVVNLDYEADARTTLVGPEKASLELFDAATRTWSPCGGSRADLRLPRGGGKLVRLQHQ